MLAEVEVAALRQAYRRAYLVGLLLCVCGPLILVLLLGAGLVKPGQHPASGVILELGYTFTLLTFAAAAFVYRRSGNIRRTFRELEAGLRPRTLFREVLLYSALVELSSLYGLAYWMLVGQENQKHPYSFILLSPLLFFVLVPRFKAWRTAADGQ